MVVFLAYTGCRFGEMRDLLWTDFDFAAGANGFVTIRRGGSGNTTKGRKVRRIPLHPALAATIGSMPRRGERVFIASDIGGRGEGPVVDTVFLRKVKRLCVECGFAGANRYKVHSFRHFFASMLARNNVSYKYALEFMGHTSSDILDLYYTMFDRDAERAIALIQVPVHSDAAA